MKLSRSGNVAYHGKTQYIVDENKFPRHIMDNGVDMCITKNSRKSGEE